MRQKRRGPQAKPSFWQVISAPGLGMLKVCWPLCWLVYKDLGFRPVTGYLNHKPKRPPIREERWP